MDKEINKEQWLEEIGDFRAAINLIDEILNNNSQDLNYKEFLELLEKSVPVVARELKNSPPDTNPFGLQIDEEMTPSKIKKRIKVYAKLPETGELVSLQDRQHWPSLPSTEVKGRPSKPNPSLKAPDTRPPTAQQLQPASSEPVEKPKPKVLYRLSTSPVVQPPDKRADNESSSESSCFSDEEDLKKTNKKSSSSGADSVKIIHHKSNLSVKSQIHEC